MPPPWIFTPYSWGLLVDEGWVFFFPTGRFASKSTFKKRAVVERVWVRVEESAFERRDCRFMAEGSLLADEVADLDALRSSKARSGFKGVKVTTSGKFQPQIFLKETGGQRALGTFDSAEEAARELARAKRDGPDCKGGAENLG